MGIKSTRLIFLVSFILLLGLCIVVFLMLSLNHPHGDWDAWAIWNLHARFIFRGDTKWDQYLTPLLDWSHPDYPLLLPAAIARGWAILGSEKQIVSIAIAFLFTFLTVGVLVSGLSLCRSMKCGLLGGTVLLGTPLFISQGATQYADVPIAFFYLATTVLICLYEIQGGQTLLFTAFTTAACSAWTKNERRCFLLCSQYPMVSSR